MEPHARMPRLSAGPCENAHTHDLADSVLGTDWAGLKVVKLQDLGHSAHFTIEGSELRPDSLLRVRTTK
jgi:hypothetical protein